MLTQTKGDIVRAALRKLGIASDATLTDVEPQSMEDAVDDLEMMMSEWYQDGQGIITGYVFADDDNPPAEGDDHGMRSSSVSAVVHNLALRIAPDYVVTPADKVVMTARYGKERLMKSTAINRAASIGYSYPQRMPVGSGNRLATYNNWNFYPGKQNANPTVTPDEGDSEESG
ncbi:packaged DNA stabilization gp4 family protein [Tatumella punctata]|uniref:Packaged DNA stabilization gp4 family protein n=1 Tax=Tatumella punctata TaxID=399969 RepID=A0ABW1VLE6_9GAMM